MMRFNKRCNSSSFIITAISTVNQKTRNSQPHFWNKGFCFIVILMVTLGILRTCASTNDNNTGSRQPISLAGNLPSSPFHLNVDHLAKIRDENHAKSNYIRMRNHDNNHHQTKMTSDVINHGIPSTDIAVSSNIYTENTSDSNVIINSIPTTMNKLGDDIGAILIQSETAALEAITTREDSFGVDENSDVDLDGDKFHSLPSILVDEPALFETTTTKGPKNAHGGGTRRMNRRFSIPVRPSCEVGTWASLIMKTRSYECIPCPSGTWSTAIASFHSSSCVACAPGTWSSQPGATSCQTISKSQLGNTPCSAGTWTNSFLIPDDNEDISSWMKSGNKSVGTHVHACISCSRGTWSSSVGASSCHNCKAGTWTLSTGATSASSCVKFNSQPTCHDNNIITALPHFTETQYFRPNTSEFCIWNNICVDDFTFTYLLDPNNAPISISSSTSTTSTLRMYDCAVLDDNYKDLCKCHNRLMINISVPRQTCAIRQLQDTISSNSSAVLISMWPGSGQFGHTMSKFIQAIVLQLATLRHLPTTVDTLVLTSKSRHVMKFSDHLEFMFAILSDLFPVVYRNQRDYINQPFGNLCFKTAYIVKNSERYFSSRQEAVAFRQLIQQKLSSCYRKELGRPLDLNRICPIARAVVLQRAEGAGLRSILNYGVVGRVLARHGIRTYENISINGVTSSLKQIDMFATFGLMISSHSSQLKNLAFAADFSIVIETTVKGFYKDAFSTGTQYANIIYAHSQGHISEKAINTTSADFNHRRLLESNYWLDEALFERDLMVALGKQRLQCGDIWKD